AFSHLGLKENPDLRAQIEKWETYFYSEQNKEEKAQALADLYIIVDERASEYELTDKGMQEWMASGQNSESNDFELFDLGYEFSKIDQDPALNDKQKMEQKTKLQEEDAKRKERAHNLRQLFRAHLLMEKDVDYIVVDSQIIIIDENTGRPQPGRRFSDGLHQAIEAKENCPIQRETQTYATVTLQNYFRMYEKLSGMTGTAITEAAEFKEIYKLSVLEVPTYCPCRRADFDDKVYMTEREKYTAILKEINEVHALGRPILIGTESVEISEKLSRILKQNHLSHSILNAKNHSKEAEIIAEAGKKGSITLSTNMAGRGTDIKLTDEVKTLGGLHVIGTTRHHSRRIDRQLRGRSGRLGDPGSSQFFVSFEDSLMRLFASPRLTSMLQRFRPPEGEPISAKVLNKSIETAQKRIEQRNYQIRKHTLEYDDVMNKQRREIYSFRNDLLSAENTLSLAENVLQEACAFLVKQYFPETKEKLWNIKGYLEWLMLHFPVTFEEKAFENQELSAIEKISSAKVLKAFQDKLLYQKELILKINPAETEIDRLLNEVVRSLLTRKIDQLWQEHLLNIDHLRNDVHLRAHGQRDPLIEFKQEAFRLFASLSQKLTIEMAKDLFRFEMISSEQKRRLEDTLKEMRLTKDRSLALGQDEESPSEEAPKTIVTEPKTGRNELCSCGSGKKFKKCCGLKELA
ncbi:MAG: SEC-C metal-binding domain-containing protein, partial [Parachlamydiales bacterium]